MRSASGQVRSGGRRLALVPTMGALHDGHLSLIREAVKRADVVVTSVFVNPTQFGPGEDYERYPRDLENDCRLAFGAGNHHVFAPTVEEMYPDGLVADVDVGDLGERLEGTSRPGHFRGVATVVAKLFRIVAPHVALFGQKDAQQVAVIRAMVRMLGFDVEIVPMPIVRESDGLAQSSRNVYLSPAEREEAPVLYRSLRLAAERFGNGSADPARIRSEMEEMISATSGVIDYVSIADADELREVTDVQRGDRLLVSVAVRFGNTRLIDNCEITIE